MTEPFETNRIFPISGKSTLLLALLGLVPYTGVINVDGVHHSSLSRSALRRHCFITVPQDPFTMTSATLRFNLDPGCEASDEVIVDALHRVQVWQHLAGEKMDARTILNAQLSDLPILSTGHSQLLCLARSIVRKHIVCLAAAGARPILLLDEATASLDPETEPLVYDVIDEVFAGHTILVVAHKMGSPSGGLRRWANMFVHLRDGRLERVDYGDT